MRTNVILRCLFVASVWVLIGVSAWQFVQGVSQPAGPVGATDPFRARVVMGPLVVGAMELFFWFRFFAREREGTRVFATMMGFFMMMPALLWLLTGHPHASIGQQYGVLFFIVGIIHFAYAAGARERGW